MLIPQFVQVLVEEVADSDTKAVENGADSDADEGMT